MILQTITVHDKYKDYLIHSRGAKTQKIKIIDHCKCNVRASKNAEQAFSTQ